jgi:lipoprotein-releasing system permease protein
MVSGIFTTGYQELDRLWSYIPLDTGEKILAPESSEEFLGIKLHDPFTRLEVQAARLQFLLPPGDRMYTWYELELSNYRSFQTTRALLLFIMAMIVAVAAINISSSLIMVVLEKRVELGVLKSLGASPSAVSSALVFTGFLAGLAGAALGIALGLFLAVNINELIRGAEGLLNLLVRAGVALVRPLAPMESPPPIRIFNAAFYLEEIPIRVRLVEVFLSAGLTVLLATVAAWFPARGAGRIRPLEVIRRF